MGYYDNLSPDFSSRLKGLLGQAQTDGVTLNPQSGYRSADDQRRAIDQVAQRNGIPQSPDLYSRGIPGMAAPVGHSLHQQGAALDWDVSDPKVKAWLYANAPNHGFRFPLPNSDSGHMQLGGGQPPPPTSQPQNGPSPMPQQPQQQGLPGLLGALQSGMQSPLFQQGLGTYNAGASGQNWAGGLMAGQKSQQEGALGSLTLKQHQMALEAAQREAQQGQARDAYMKSLSPADPAFHGLPPALMSMAKGMNDPSILTGAYKSKMDLDQQMAIAKATGDVQMQMHLAQKKAELELQLQQQQAQWGMVNRLMNQGGGQAQPRRYNPATGELE